MGKLYERLDERLQEFIGAQPLFFVATAPLEGGHVNVSPKGYKDTFAVLDDRTVAYLDLNGSGAETIAHLRENGRITVMFCSFDRTPKILRLQGTGRVVTPDLAEWDSVESFFWNAGKLKPRSIIVVDVDRIADSCGYAVPYMELVEERGMAKDWADRKNDEELAAYQAQKNRVSIDGLPALT